MKYHFYQEKDSMCKYLRVKYFLHTVCESPCISHFDLYRYQLKLQLLHERYFVQLYSMSYNQKRYC